MVDMVPAVDAKKICPQVVLSYYESLISWKFEKGFGLGNDTSDSDSDSDTRTKSEKKKRK